MKKHLFTFFILLSAISVKSQVIQDLFQQSDVQISWLGVDFSHVKLIGSYAEFLEAGEKNSMQIRELYFPAWNKVILNEREKYDISGMLNKSEIYYDIDMITGINAQANTDEMESYKAPKYTDEEIQAFVSQYDLTGKEGIGVLFIAECLNKSAYEGWFHFVAINMKSKEVLFHRRLLGVPKGFGLRNYWANSIYQIMIDIKSYYFKKWKMQMKRAGEQI
jgi:hypothetical protein